MNSMPDPSRDQKDEELIARLLRQGTEPTAQNLEPTEQARLESWDSFLQSCRAELQAPPTQDQVREERLRQRIFGASTREDLSLRGDFSLMRSFLRQRLNSSLLLRVVAASLLLHMVALPVLAYYSWVRPEPVSTVYFDLNKPDQTPPYAEVEPEPSSDLVPAAWPELDSLESTGPAAGWLPAHLLEGADRTASDPRSVIWKDSLGLALLAEALLEQPSTPNAARQEFVLAELGRAIESLRSTNESPALRRYLGSAWLRMRAAGLGEADVEFEAQCALWSRDSKALEGSARSSAYADAAGELATR